MVTTRLKSTLLTEFRVNKQIMSLLFAILSLCLLVIGSQPVSTLTIPLVNEEAHLTGQLAEKSVKPAPKQSITFSIDTKGCLYANQDIVITKYIFKDAPSSFLDVKLPLQMKTLVNAGDVLFEANFNGRPVTFRAPFTTSVTELFVKTDKKVTGGVPILRFDVAFMNETLASGGSSDFEPEVPAL